MSILLATDFSDASRAALEMAARLARSRGLPLVVAHFVEEAQMAPWGSQFELPSDLEETFRDEAHEQLEQFYDEVVPEAERPKAVELRVELRRPADGIPEVADEGDFELVVLGATGRNRVAEFFLGSTAEDVVRGSEGPVLVVPPDGVRSSYDRILAPVDFSECSRQSLELAASVARHEGASLQILHAHVPPTSDGSMISPMVSPERIREMEARREDRFREFVEGFDLDDLSVQTELRTGVAQNAIAESAEEYGTDLVVMGTHGRRGFEKFFLGSTAAKVLRRMPCAVMTVRARDDRPE